MTDKYQMPKLSEAFASALKLLETTQTVIITGTLGSGKTHLAYDLIVALLDGTDEFDPFIVTSPCDIELLDHTPSPAVVLIDDCFGVCGKYDNVYRKHIKTVERLLHRKRLFLIFTSDTDRIHNISEPAHEFLSRLHCKEIDLDSNEFQITDNEESKILSSWIELNKRQSHSKKWLRQHTRTKQLDDIGYPVLCQLTGIGDFPKLAEQPLVEIDKFLTHLQRESVDAFVLLLLITLNTDNRGRTKLSAMGDTFDHVAEVLSYSDISFQEVSGAVLDLKNAGVIKEQEDTVLSISSSLITHRVLKILLDILEEKCISLLSLTAMNMIDFVPEEEVSSYRNTFRASCVLTSKVAKALAAHILNIMEGGACHVFQELAASTLWGRDYFLETVISMYGHHFFFSVASSQISLLVYLIRAKQRKTVKYLLDYLKQRFSGMLNTSVDLELTKSEAVICADVETLDSLLELSPEVSHALLSKAVECDNLALLQKFSINIHHGTICNSETSLIQHACLCGSFGVLEFMVKKLNSKALASEVRKRDNKGMTLLHRAAVSGDQDVFCFIEKLGADLKAKSENGFTVAHFCAQQGHLGLLKYILERNRELVDENANHGFTCTHIAAMEGHTDILGFLFSLPVNPGALIEEENTLSHTAAANGRVGALKFILSTCRDQLLQTNANTCTPSHLAAMYGQTETLRFLFKHGIRPDVLTADQRTLVHTAAFDGHLETIEFLCSFYPKLCKRTDIDGNTSLHDAAAGGDLDVFQKLVDTGVDPLIVNNDGATVLHDAAFYGRFKLVQHICSMYPHMIDNVSRSGLTPAIGAALGGHLEIIDYLEKQGADLKLQTREGSTALHEAAYAGHLLMVQYLKTRFPDMQDVRNKRSFAPCHFASQEGHLDVLKCLLPDHTDDLPLTDQGQTILHIATYNGMMDIVRFLCSKIPSLLSSEDSDGAIALHYAARGGSIDALVYLTDKGLDPKTVTNSGSTILHLAAFEGHLDMVLYVCEKYPELAEVKDSSGHSAAHYVAASGEVHVLLNILKHGISPRIRAENGSSLLMKAAGSGKLTMVQYLCTEYPDMLGFCDNYGCNMLHYAACGGHIDIVKYGVCNGLNPMSLSDEQYTLLHVATFHCHPDTVAFLCESFPDMINFKDSSQRTPEDMAKEFGHVEIVSIFENMKVHSDTRSEPGVPVVSGTGSKLSDVLCCSRQMKCGGCKRLWGIFIGIVCFCRK